MFEVAASILRKINDFRVVRHLHDFMAHRLYPTLGVYRDPYLPNFGRRFHVAAIAVSLATLVYLGIAHFFAINVVDHFVHSHLLFVIFTLAVGTTAWLGGFWSGVVAILFSSVSSIAIAKSSLFSIHFSRDFPVRISLFILGNLGVSFLIATLIRSRIEFEEINRQLDVERRNLDVAHRKIIRVLDSVSDIFISLDNNGRFIYLNRTAEKLFGRPRLDLVGRTMWQEYPPRSFNDVFYDQFRETLQKGRPVSFEQHFKPFHKWFMVRMFPTLNAVSIYFSEITARKEEEQRKDEFISLASHELRVPVTTLQLLSSLLRERLEQIPDQELQEYADDMHRQIGEIVALVVDLLDTSRLEQDSMVLDKKPFSLDQLIGEVTKSLEFIFASHKIELALGAPTILTADQNRLRQVLTNLITNAIHYSPGGERVLVRKSESPTEIIVEVRDFGPGVPTRIQKKIFNRFYHTNSPHSHLHHGLGLGLYLSKQIIERHGGRIWVESEEGKGARFLFGLPKTDFH